MQATSPTNRYRLQLSLIGALAVLAAAAMMLHGLNSFSMWFDEIRMVLPTLDWNPLKLSTWVFRPGHPPLYFLLLRGWITLAGQSDFSLRMLSGLFGVLTAAVLVRIGRDLSRTIFAGVAAALLFGAMGFVRYFIHETHNYALLMLVCMILVFFYIRWRAHPERRLYAAGSVLATAAVMYTHYYGAFFILALNIFVLIAHWRRVNEIFRWIGFELLAAVLYIPWLGVIVFLVNKVASRMGLKKGNRVPTANSTKPQVIIDTILSLLSNQQVVFGILLLAGVAGVVLLVRSRREQPRKTLDPVLLTGLLVLGSLVIALVVNLVFKTFTSRRVIYVLPALALLIGTMLIGLPRYVREVVLVGAVALIYAGGYSSYLPGDWGFRQMVQTIAESYRPGDLVYLQMPPTSLPGLPLTYYTNTLLPRGAAVMTQGDSGLDTADSRAYFGQQVFLPHVLARTSFWVVSSTDPVYGQPSLDWVDGLKPGFTQVKSTQIGIFKVTLYSAPARQRSDMANGQDLSSTLGLPVTLGANQFELDRAQISRETAAPGDTLTLWLDWRALTTPDQDYAVYVHLRKGDTLIAQQDGDPEYLGQTLATSLWPRSVPIYDEHRLTIPPGTPPGAYLLLVGLYNRATGARLQVTPAGVTIGELKLDAIQVTQ